jgi:hypothetical protein
LAPLKRTLLDGAPCWTPCWTSNLGIKIWPTIWVSKIGENLETQIVQNIKYSKWCGSNSLAPAAAKVSRRAWPQVELKLAPSAAALSNWYLVKSLFVSRS